MTPFQTDGKLYLHKLEANVARYAKTSASGMMVLGRAAEPDALSDAEKRAVLKTAIQGCTNEKVMIASAGHESLRGTLALAEDAAAMGYDVIAVRQPACLEPSSMPLESVTYLQMIADRCPLPVLLVEGPGQDLPLEMLAHVATHPQIIGLLARGGTPDRLARVRSALSSNIREVNVTLTFAAVTNRMSRENSGTQSRTGFVLADSLAGTGGMTVAAKQPAKMRTKRVGFQLLSEPAGAMLAAWEAAWDGSVPALSACAPQACCEVWQAFKDGDPGLAQEKQQRIHAAASRMESALGIAALKYGCDLNGYFGGSPRLPLFPLSAAQRAEIEEDLDGIRN